MKKTLLLLFSLFFLNSPAVFANFQVVDIRLGDSLLEFGFIDAP